LIDLPIVKNWKRGTTLFQILNEILKVMAAPDLSDKKNEKLVQAYKENSFIFDQMALEMTKKYALEFKAMHSLL